jgi:predicted AAA+ superfamily ATPase
MEILLEEFYKQDLHNPYFTERKAQVGEQDTLITGITQSGKSALIKHYLLQQRKATYLYIDCEDIRIETDALNRILPEFCREHTVQILALDNYDPSIQLPEVGQLILASREPLSVDGFETLVLHPLDFEEFLAFEQKYDSTALNHFLQLGGMPGMHKTPSEERMRLMQTNLAQALSDIEFDLIVMITRMATPRLSAFALYERLKGERKISKDMLYKSLQSLIDKGYLHTVEKFAHARATKKIYLADIAFKLALSTQKHFGQLFETLVALELIKHGHRLTYEEGVDFYLGEEGRVVLCMPFSNKEMLFKKIEGIEGFLITRQVARVDVVTMSSEGELHHPFVDVEMMPFGNWALLE